MSELKELGYQVFEDNRANQIMEIVRKKIIDSKQFGITVIGPYMTIRFKDGNSHVEVSMQVTSITDSKILDPQFEDDDK